MNAKMTRGPGRPTRGAPVQEPSLTQNVRNNIRALLDLHDDVSRGEFARRAGIKGSVLKRWLNGRGKIPVCKVYDIACAFNVPMLLMLEDHTADGNGWLRG